MKTMSVDMVLEFISTIAAIDEIDWNQELDVDDALNNVRERVLVYYQGHDLRVTVRNAWRDESHTMFKDLAPLHTNKFEFPVQITSHMNISGSGQIMVDSPLTTRFCIEPDFDKITWTTVVCGAGDNTFEIEYSTSPNRKQPELRVRITGGPYAGTTVDLARSTDITTYFQSFKTELSDLDQWIAWFAKHESPRVLVGNTVEFVDRLAAKLSRTFAPESFEHDVQHHLRQCATATTAAYRFGVLIDTVPSVQEHLLLHIKPENPNGNSGKIDIVSNVGSRAVASVVAATFSLDRERITFEFKQKASILGFDMDNQFHNGGAYITTTLTFVAHNMAVLQANVTLAATSEPFFEPRTCSVSETVYW